MFRFARRWGTKRPWGEPTLAELVPDPALAAVEEAPFGQEYPQPYGRRPGMAIGQNVMRGGRPNAPQDHQVGAVTQAIKQLEQSVKAAAHGGSLATLQASFDNLRNHMQAAFPSGGPNGAVG